MLDRVRVLVSESQSAQSDHDSFQRCDSFQPTSAPPSSRVLSPSALSEQVRASREHRHHPMKQPRESTTRRLVSPRPCLQQRKTIGTRLTPTTRVRGSREGWESGFQPCDFFHYGVRQCGHAGLKRPHLLRPSSFVPRTCFVWQAAASPIVGGHCIHSPPWSPLVGPALERKTSRD